jgi:hypothetical protein
MKPAVVYNPVETRVKVRMPDFFHELVAEVIRGDLTNAALAKDS